MIILRMADSLLPATAVPLFQSTVYARGGVNVRCQIVTSEGGDERHTIGRWKLSGLVLNFFSASLSELAPLMMLEIPEAPT